MLMRAIPEAYMRAVTMSSKGRDKKVSLSFKLMLELIKKLEPGVSVTCMCNEDGIKKHIVFNTHRRKEKLNQFLFRFIVAVLLSGSRVS